MMEIDSDEENMAVRKISVKSPGKTPVRNRSLLTLPTQTSTKRKLQTPASASVKTDLASIYQFGDSSDSESHSQPKFKPPATPRGCPGFISSMSTKSSKQVTASKTDNRVAVTPRSAKPLSSTSPSPSSLRTFLMPQTRPARSTSREETRKKKTKKEQTLVVNFDEVMAVSSDLDSC